ncbi:hypothetical protein DFH08DRAFT_944791 [Mycena albidolilacea]|uniref:Uncharacterized protein n=1 Tax=Mycena albidolilacea TaxID=1033008 RepID=A0AAD6Z4Y0_9AGAR|nr:hypothetical protein DFH08DRAFT_944791 [Mycena albidolilacea]
MSVQSDNRKTVATQMEATQRVQPQTQGYYGVISAKMAVGAKLALESLEQFQSEDLAPELKPKERWHMKWIQKFFIGRTRTQDLHKYPAHWYSHFKTNPHVDTCWIIFPSQFKFPRPRSCCRDHGTADYASTFARIRSGEINVLGTELPYLMYRYGYIYNAADMEDGLLEGPTLYTVAKPIYQGPSAALKAPGFNRGKAGNAALNGVTSLNGRDIAYIACQLRFPAVVADHYPEFFWSIVNLLRGDEGQAILDRFNYPVFGTTVSAVKKNAAAATNTPSDFEVLEAQRAAKRARKVAAAVAAAATLLRRRSLCIM